jgi:hypothetical protein
LTVFPPPFFIDTNDGLDLTRKVNGVGWERSVRTPHAILRVTTRWGQGMKIEVVEYVAVAT